MPGSADLCFLTDENVEKVLEVFQDARMEVRTLAFLSRMVQTETDLYRFWKAPRL